MRQTFFFIPPSWIDPMFYIWVVVGVAIIGYTLFRHSRKKASPTPVSSSDPKSQDTPSLSAELWNSVPVVVIGALIIKFVVPMVIVADDNDPQKLLGIPIRGYGFFLLLAIVTGVLLAVSRAKRLGLHPDKTLNLCFFLFAAGIVGARAFYVIQYWSTFETVRDILDMTKGGLVVYGSAIGATLAAVVYLKWHKLPTLLMLDVIAPCMLIGLSIGRIGCLMNGCCWGGLCESDLPSITFPESSPPYSRQVETGELFGMKIPLSKDPKKESKVVDVDENGAAAERGIRVGATVKLQVYDPNPNDTTKPDAIVYQVMQGGQVKSIAFEDQDVPWRSLPVHPTQIYSSINAFFAFLFLWFYFPRRRHDGEVFGLMLIVYPIGRFLLEFIRSDEMGQLGTGFTISQLISFASIAAGFAIIIYGTLYPKRSNDFINSQTVKSNLETR